MAFYKKGVLFWQFLCWNFWVFLSKWWPRKCLESLRICLKKTRSYAALRAADLDWIVGPGHSLGRYILGKNHEKPTWNHGSQLAFEMGEGGGAGITEKRNLYGVTTDL